jgi:hypothetical protein
MEGLAGGEVPKDQVAAVADGSDLFAVRGIRGARQEFIVPQAPRAQPGEGPWRQRVAVGIHTCALPAIGGGREQGQEKGVTAEPP